MAPPVKHSYFTCLELVAGQCETTQLSDDASASQIVLPLCHISRTDLDNDPIIGKNAHVWAGYKRRIVAGFGSLAVGPGILVGNVDEDGILINNVDFERVYAWYTRQGVGDSSGHV